MKMIMRINCCKALEAKQNSDGSMTIFRNRCVSSSNINALYNGYWSWVHRDGPAFSFCFGNQLPYPSACFGIIK